MSQTIDIRGEAPASPYTGVTGWETEAEQGVLIMAACTLHYEFYLKASPELPVSRKPIVVEIGSENGMSASLFARFSPFAHIVCIEIDESANFMHNLEAVGLHENIIPLYGNSSKMDWAKESTAYLRPKPEIDLLFIDGDHSFDGALADLRNFAPHVADGGWLLLHDCACVTNRLPHEQHKDVSRALATFMEEVGASLGYRFLFSVDTLMVWRRF